MSILSELYDEFDHVEALNAGTLPELLALEEDAIIPYVKAQWAQRPMDAPTEAIARYEAVRAVRYPVRRLEDIRREIGSKEAEARMFLFHIGECDKEIARLAALPYVDERRQERIAEETRGLENLCASHQRRLDWIGVPRSTVLASDAMKVVA